MHVKNRSHFYEQVPAQGGDPKPADPSGQGDDPKPAASAPEVDLTKLTGDQLVKVLEHPDFFNLPRIKELREQAAEAKKLKEAQVKADEKRLEDEKKWEDLATQRKTENESLQQQLKTNTIDQALTHKLVSESVVDLEAALKLVDRSKVSIDDNGSVQGIDEALSALKTDKTYLFKPGTPSPVGGPTNPGNGGNQPTGPAKFKRSQITPEFYKEHAAEINEAAAKGLIEDDGPAQP